MKKIFILFILLILCSCTSNNVEVIEENEVIEDIAKYGIEDAKDLKYGDIFLFGTYEQDNDLNKKEEIEWIVMENVSSEELILISKYGLDHVTYDDAFNWLKNDLMNSFSDEEKQYVIKTTMFTHSEAENYFENDIDRICETTDYAINNGVHVYEDSRACWWWLLTNNMAHGPHNVRTDGHIKFVDTNSDDIGYAIRPVLYISTTPFSSSENKIIEQKDKLIIEILDDSMNTYKSANKKADIIGKVYKGQQFECINYYETVGYKWYKIDEEKWIGDGNGNRVSVISGTPITISEVDTSANEEEEVDTKTKLINEINNLEDHHMSNFCLYGVDINENNTNRLKDYINNNYEEIDNIEYVRIYADMNYPYDSNRFVHIRVYDDEKRVNIQANVYGNIENNVIIKDSINNLLIRDKNNKTIEIEKINEELKDLLYDIEIYNFSPATDYESVNTVLDPVKEIVNNLYKDYEINVHWSD